METLNMIYMRLGEILSMNTLTDTRIVIASALALIYVICVIIDLEDV